MKTKQEIAEIQLSLSMIEAATNKLDNWIENYLKQCELSGIPKSSIPQQVIGNIRTNLPVLKKHFNQ